MAPKLDLGNSITNDFGSGGAFAIKTAKGNGLANRKNAPISGRRDSGSPTYEASNLRRMGSGSATLGIKESDEEIESERSEDEAGSRRSGRSNASGISRESHSSKRSSNYQGSDTPGSRRPGTGGRRAVSQSQPESTRLTKSALKSLRIDRVRRTLQEETLQRKTAKVRIAKKDQERKERRKKKSKEVEEGGEDELRFEVDHQRGMLVRKGLYSDGTKPWQQRFGDPHADVLSMVGLRGFYEKAKKSFYWAF